MKVIRGWCSVDVSMRGEKFRYICAHLEEETAPEIQMLQAIELIEGPGHVCLPVILSGISTPILQRNGVKTYDAFGAADSMMPGGTAPSDLAGGLTRHHDEFSLTRASR